MADTMMYKHITADIIRQCLKFNISESDLIHTDIEVSEYIGMKAITYFREMLSCEVWYEHYIEPSNEVVRVEYTEYKNWFHHLIATISRYTILLGKLHIYPKKVTRFIEIKPNKNIHIKGFRVCPHHDIVFEQGKHTAHFQFLDKSYNINEVSDLNYYVRSVK